MTCKTGKNEKINIPPKATNKTLLETVIFGRFILGTRENIKVPIHKERQR